MQAWIKRRKVEDFELMDSESAKAKLAAAKQKLGREIRVFETSTISPTPNEVSNTEETDDFYEFTPEDYYRVLASKQQDKGFKTRKIREQEEAARRSKITKSVIRVRFPDNHTLEATFHPLETFQNLIDLLIKVVARPELQFYIYTTPPKKQLRDMSQDFYSAGFIPGAIVYFSYDLSGDEDNEAMKSGPFLHDEIMSLKGLDLIPDQDESLQANESQQVAPEPVVRAPVIQEPKPTEKKLGKPKWLKR